MIRFFTFVLLTASLWGRIALANDPAPSEDISRNILVDPEKGDDRNDGRSKPVKTIARSIALALPGDTIHLAPTTYFESADFSTKHGLPGQPITLDGHGAMLDGSEAVTSKEWKEFLPGLYRRDHLYENTDETIVNRWFLLRDGQLERMDRCAKGSSDPLKPSDELLPGDWTYVKGEDAFYLMMGPGKSLDAAGLRYPARSSGVIISGSGSWITIKNITATHVYDDGFHIHGAQENLVFENISAIDCGDDGFSAEEGASCSIKGFVSIGNASGLYDTGTSRTHYKNVFIKDNIGYDLCFMGREHSLENALIESSAAQACWLDGSHLKGKRSSADVPAPVCQVRMKNVVMRRVEEGLQELFFGNNSFLSAAQCTFSGFNVMLAEGGGVEFSQCQIGGIAEKPRVLIFPNSIWRGEGNRYDLESLQFGQSSFTQKTFAAFQKLTGSEAGSQWLGKAGD